MRFQDFECDSEVGRTALRRLTERYGGALADMARSMDRLFLLDSSWAPGFWFVGGRTPERALGPAGVFSVGGAGLSLEDALASAAGEAIERTAQVERTGDVARSAAPTETALPDALRALADRLQVAADMDVVAARDAVTAAAVEAPADWVLRRAPVGPWHVPGAALSTGAAAGRTVDDAALRALLELIERDAAALWWRGGRPARALTSGDPHAVPAVRLLSAYRRNAAGRETRLIDISTDIGIPVIVAISTDDTGAGFACGLGCRLTRAEAAKAAVTELCQSEIGVQFAAAKREQLGDGALSETDRAHLDRAACVSVAAMPCYNAPALPDPACPSSAHALASHMAARGAPAVLVDVTRGAMPVMKAIAPDLQPYPGDIKRPRLARALEEFGSSASWTNGCSLM